VTDWLPLFTAASQPCKTEAYSISLLQETKIQTMVSTECISFSYHHKVEISTDSFEWNSVTWFLLSAMENKKERLAVCTGRFVDELVSLRQSFYLRKMSHFRFPNIQMFPNANFSRNFLGFPNTDVISAICKLFNKFFVLFLYSSYTFTLKAD
jgi:hypothetical protein